MASDVTLGPLLKVFREFVIGYNVDGFQTRHGSEISSTHSIIGLPADFQQRLGLV